SEKPQHQSPPPAKSAIQDQEYLFHSVCWVLMSAPFCPRSKCSVRSMLLRKDDEVQVVRGTYKALHVRSEFLTNFERFSSNQRNFRTRDERIERYAAMEIIG
ncbi:hypothetical protein HAX54_039415, partial [Datura stramonium]|nr:hypothetical protein [Datura stramonium]